MPDQEKPTLTPAERRARREARRALQREANVGRAAKMHKARVEWESAPEPGHADDEGWAGRYQIGCSGWYYWHWHGGFYPRDLPRAAWFPFYAEQFDTVELNAPFIRGQRSRRSGAG